MKVYRSHPMPFSELIPLFTPVIHALLCIASILLIPAATFLIRHAAGTGLEQAKKVLKNLDSSITVKTVKIYDNKVKKGWVISQSVAKDSVFSEGHLSSVLLTVSLGREPDAVGIMPQCIKNIVFFAFSYRSPTKMLKCLPGKNIRKQTRHFKIWFFIK